jgi:hypothetical protein
MLRDRPEGPPEAAIDNDVIIKTACYGLSAGLHAGRHVGVLGAARYVITKRIGKMKLEGNHAEALEAAQKFISRSTVLEPTESELRLSASIESAAQREGLELDAGESQLTAMVIMRPIPVLETGDKRAIRALEVLLDKIAELSGLHGRVRCLEQLAMQAARRCGAKHMAPAICSEPNVDKVLSICFRCFSPPPNGTDLDAEGLASYIEALRRVAPRVLMG